MNVILHGKKKRLFWDSNKEIEMGRLSWISRDGSKCNQNVFLREMQRDISHKRGEDRHRREGNVTIEAEIGACQGMLAATRCWKRQERDCS